MSGFKQYLLKDIMKRGDTQVKELMVYSNMAVNKNINNK